MKEGGVEPYKEQQLECIEDYKLPYHHKFMSTKIKTNEIDIRLEPKTNLAQILYRNFPFKAIYHN